MAPEITKISILADQKDRELLVKLINYVIEDYCSTLLEAIYEGVHLNLSEEELVRAAVKLRDIGSQLGASWEQLDAWDNAIDALGNCADEDEEETTNEEDSKDTQVQADKK